MVYIIDIIMGDSVQAIQNIVVNVRVSNLRPRCNNLKEWMNNPDNQYIGRRHIVFIDGARYPPTDSIWANPFKVDEHGRDECIARYRKYIEERLEKEPDLKTKLLQLKGKKLGCWCKPDKCHGDVLVDLIQKYSPK